ncbi:MAG: DegT/DnrJ/EryC1/StrS family aminotransferase [Planctomycetes bacterium]|nr:DegT/DnrJ/EryC1/StrS family aminotransferase [Planctomycetota bacterium]
MRNHGASVSEEVRHHGSKPYLLPEFNLLGFNYRMTDLQGAIGVVQLGKLDSLIRQRQRWAQFYTDELADVCWLRTPHVPADCVHSWQAYVCCVDDTQAPVSRNEMMRRLEERGVSTRPGTHAVHMLGFYRDRFGLSAEDFPVARDCAQFTMALPLHNRMTEEDYRYVVQSVKDVGVHRARLRVA